MLGTNDPGVAVLCSKSETDRFWNEMILILDLNGLDASLIYFWVTINALNKNMIIALEWGFFQAKPSHSHEFFVTVCIRKKKGNTCLNICFIKHLLGIR